MIQQAQTLTPRGFVKTLSTIHMGVITGPLIFGAVMYYLNPSSVFTFSDSRDIFMILVPLAAISSVFLGNLVFKQVLKGISKTSSLRDKLAKFQTASIIKYALIEAAAFFGVIAFMQTKNLAFMAISGVLVFYFLLLRPSIYKTAKALNLTGSDRDAFNRPDQPIES